MADFNKLPLEVLTKEEYDGLNISGMLWEFYPEATGSWYYDTNNPKYRTEAKAPSGKTSEALKEAREIKEQWTDAHYDNIYQLTEEDIERGNIKVDVYWVAKQWKIGSKDDSGALWHSLKSVARFGEKNSVEREVKALYNQAKALARIYNVDLGDKE